MTVRDFTASQRRHALREAGKLPDEWVPKKPLHVGGLSTSPNLIRLVQDAAPTAIQEVEDTIKAVNQQQKDRRVVLGTLKQLANIVGDGS